MSIHASIQLFVAFQDGPFRHLSISFSHWIWSINARYEWLCLSCLYDITPHVLPYFFHIVWLLSTFLTLRANVFSWFNMTAFACVLELLAEPLYILSQRKKYYQIRVYTEPVATLLRCLTTFIFITKGHSKMVTAEVFTLLTLYSTYYALSVSVCYHW